MLHLTCKSEHVVLLLMELHWLLIEKLVEIKILLDTVQSCSR